MKIFQYVKKSLLLGGALILPFVGALTFPQSVKAELLPYQALVSSGSVILEAGQTKQITLKFKNVGTQTWYSGRAKTAVYLYGSSSVFGHTSWLTNDLPALIRETSVKPGAMASAVFYVQAPKTAGTYTEKFLLSYGTNAWIKNSSVPVTFTVTKPSSAVTAPATPVVAPVSAPVAETVASSAEFKAELVDKGGIEWQIMPEEHALLNLKFKNTGTQTWKNSGANYLSLYTWSPKYRKSYFEDFSWKENSQAGFLVESEVKPGQIGTIRLELRGPDVPGAYQETFQLAVEDKAWVDGGSVSLPIKVPVPDSYISKGTASGQTIQSSGTYNAVLMLASQKQVTLSGNGRLQLIHGFKNAGTAIWNSRGLQLVSVTPSLGTYSSVRDESWVSSIEPVKATDVTAPGQIGYVTYTIKAPVKKGEYTASFKLMADGQEVSGGTLDIPITVTADGAYDEVPISVPGPTVSSGSVTLPLTGDVSTLPDEPIMRAGLYRTTDDRMQVKGINGGMIASLNGTKVCEFQVGQIATVSFQRTNKTYILSGPGCDTRSAGYYVLSADDGISPLEITDYSRPIAWLPGSNDNKFRAKLELRYSPTTDVVWVINELPFESYLKGIAETSNVSPLEYQKALLTAARTYGLYHIQRGTKHASEFYHVDSHLDQVYRGYGQEARSPNIVDGVMKTRGEIVTYDGKLAITPYYSRSDGRTRDWTEVWGGSGYAWLKSVPVPHDIGQTLWGHGVGMSARGALYMASKDGNTYDQILKHFYVNTELRRAFK